MTLVAVLLSHEQDAAAWRERFARGETMDRTPYGYDRAEAVYDIEWSTSRPDSRGLARIRGALARRLGFDVVHVLHNARLLRRADIIWTHTEREHLAVAFLRRLLAVKAPVIAQSVWLWDRWSGLGAVRRRLYTRLLRSHHVEIVHSAVNLAESRTRVPGRSVMLVPFGSAAVTRDPATPASGRPTVLAVGNDIDRDWRTLAEALSRLPEFDGRVASSRRAARELPWPSSVQIAPAADRRELERLYRSAAVIVVPLRHNLHVSGATACIEALAARRPLVATDTGGLADYLGGAAHLVQEGDVEGLAEAIRSAARASVGSGDPWVERGLTQADYVNRYVLLTEWLLGRRSRPTEVSLFRPVPPLSE